MDKSRGVRNDCWRDKPGVATSVSSRLVSRIDLPIRGRNEVREVQIWAQLVDIHLEDRLRLAWVKNFGQNRTIPATPYDTSQGSIVSVPRKIHNMRLRITACNLIQIRGTTGILRRCLSIQAQALVCSSCLSTLDSVNEFALIPLPGQVPVVQSPNGTVIVDSYLSEAEHYIH